MAAVLSVVLALMAAASNRAAQPPVSPEMAAQRYGALPLAFERNVGQTDARVQFLSRNRGYTLFLTGSDAVLATAAATIRTTLVGAARHAAATGLDEQPGVTHYYTGNDPRSWTTNVRSYARVRYAQVYPGIDVVYYGNQSQVEYDFLVAPAADPSKIQIDIDGADRLEVDARGHLLAHLRDDRVEWKTPAAYQDVAGVRKNVPVRYSLRRHHRVRLEVGAYDRRLPLVIDPLLVYSTYLGGSGDDPTLGVGADASGNVYVTGTTGSVNFPATTGPAPSNTNPSMFVTSLNPAGSALRYSALFATSSGRAIAVDAAGNAYVTAVTSTLTFPTTPGAYRPPPPGFNNTSDGVVVKLAPDGSIVYSTYLEENPAAIAVDPAGNAYVSGSMSCCSGHATLVAGWVAKLNATGTARPYYQSIAPSIIPSHNSTSVSGIAVDPDGTAYVTGSTQSFTLQTTPGAYQPTHNAPVDLSFLTPRDAFVVKIATDGTILYATYLGTAAADEGVGIAIDAAGNAFVAGHTYPANSTGSSLGPGTDVFVTTLNATGSAVLSSRVFGGSQEDFVMGVAQDRAGHKYVVGRTKSTDFPTTSAARQAHLGGGGSDGFLTKVSPDGSTTLYSSYFGGSGPDRVNAVAVDARGSVYVTGGTASADLPVTPTAFQPTLDGPADAFIAKMRLTTSAATAGAFDGDGRAGIAVYRPSSGTWYVQSSTDPNSGSVITWGGSADLPVPGDYDGDGTTDIAVYRPSTSVWYVLPSASGYTYASFFSLSFGRPGDIPVPGDYDGDGATDLAVYHSSTGVWSYRASGTPGTPTVAWALGRGGDVPVPGDYDGDGRIDLAIYRPLTGTWTFRRSSSGNTTSQTIAWGLPDDVPVPGDYDGDGVTDLAVYRPVNGVWYVLKSISNYSTSLTVQWGLSGDIPAPADYDGDGAADLTVYRPSTGMWFILQSGTGFASSQTVGWGLPGDTPVAAAIQSHAMSAAASSPPVSTLANQSRLADFDRDGRADLAVFRPSQGEWHTLTSSTNYATATSYIFGQSTDLPVFGDFDGDGRADLTVFRGSTGTWSSLLSGAEFTTTRDVSWGLSGDVPAAADYDGDSRTDIAVFRPSTGQWFIKWSSTDYATTTTLSWGLDGDVPVPGDYDGDGLADLAVFRPVTGEWLILESHSGYQTASTHAWGLNGDIAVPGDYDGDGTTDLAVFRPATGSWYMLRSSTGFTTSMTVSWGLAGDVPVAADFDGDGITDLAVFRLGPGIPKTWYITKSSNGFAPHLRLGFGLPGDVPVLKRP